MRVRSRGFSRLGLILCLLAASVSFGRLVVPYTDGNPVITDPLTGQVIEKFQEAELGAKARLAVFVAETKHGTTQLDVNSMEAMRPASLMKLITTAAALEVLGSDQTFKTDLVAAGRLENGKLFGDLVIVGGGDPSLGPRFQEDPNHLLMVIEGWAKAARKAGIREVVGNVIGDSNRYPVDPVALGWEPREFGEWYSAEVGPLCFNENVIDVILRAGDTPDDLVKATLRPKTRYVKFSNGIRVGSPRLQESSVRYFRSPNNNEIRARGRVPRNTTKYGFASVHDPARFAAYLLLEEMERKNMRVSGGAVSSPLVGYEAPTTGTQVLQTIESPPLRDLLPIVNSESQNLYAEVLLRETGLALGAEPSFRESARAVTDWLHQNGLHKTGFLMVDGSGLSPVNRLPVRMIGNLLLRMKSSRHGGVYTSSLARPGEGSLENRFQELEFSNVMDTIKAKTGYLEGTHALAGYFVNKRGSEYAFAIIVNDYDPRKSREARDFVDHLVLHLYQSDILP